MKAMNKSPSQNDLLRYQSAMDQYWAEITALVEKDPRGTATQIHLWTLIAQGKAIPAISVAGPEMRQIAWLAVAAMTEGIYRVAQRQQEEG